MAILIDLDALALAALAATPSPWRVGKSWPHEAICPHNVVTDTDIGPKVLLQGNQNFYEEAKKDAAFVAHANPAVVLELVRRLRAAEEALNASQAQATPVDRRCSLEHSFPHGMKLGAASKFLTVKEGDNWGWEAEYSQGSRYGYKRRDQAVLGAVSAAYQAQCAQSAGTLADARTLVAFIFNRFCLPEDAGELPDEVVAAVRRLEATLAVPA